MLGHLRVASIGPGVEQFVGRRQCGRGCCRRAAGCPAPVAPGRVAYRRQGGGRAARIVMSWSRSRSVGSGGGRAAADQRRLAGRGRARWRIVNVNVAMAHRRRAAAGDRHVGELLCASLGSRRRWLIGGKLLAIAAPESCWSRSRCSGLTPRWSARAMTPRPSAARTPSRTSSTTSLADIVCRAENLGPEGLHEAPL